HRPCPIPALGLRARNGGVVIVSRTSAVPERRNIMSLLSWLRNPTSIRSPRGRAQHRLAASRFPPRLEVLEGRCLPSTVTTLNDAGPGSLRDAIVITPSGGTVDFQAGLTGTILLSTGELAITKDLTIAGPGADVLTVSGNHASGVFNIQAAFTVGISGMTIADSRVATSFDGGILNSGTLTVANSILSGNSETVFNSGMLPLTNST